MKEQILDILQDLIKIQSVSNDIKKLKDIISYVEKHFEGYENVFIKKYVFNEKISLVLQNFEGLESDVTFLGHLDVVPPSEENQFFPIFKDGKIYARGAGDMKSGDAIILALFKEILEKKYDAKKISLIFTTDEELGGENCAKMLAEMGYKSKLMIIPDSGSLDEIVHAEKGIIKLKLKVFGNSCHASRPWLGKNAIDISIQIYDDLKKQIQEFQKLYDTDEHWGSSVNLTYIKSGTASNVIPEESEVWFDIRVTEKFIDMKNNELLIKNILSNYDCEVLDLSFGDLLYTDKDNEMLKKYVETYKDVLKKEPKVVKEHGASDARYFSVKGVPILFHRPTCKNIHSKQEYVEEKAIFDIYDVYKKFIFD